MVSQEFVSIAPCEVLTPAPSPEGHLSNGGARWDLWSKLMEKEGAFFRAVIRWTCSSRAARDVPRPHVALDAMAVAAAEAPGRPARAARRAATAKGSGGQVPGRA